MVMVMVLPGVQLPRLKSNNPCGKVTPAGALPAGGLAALPVSGMNLAMVNVHPAPPPVKLAVMLPGPVGDGPVKLLFAGVTFACAEAAPLPIALVAVTEHR